MNRVNKVLRRTATTRSSSAAVISQPAAFVNGVLKDKLVDEQSKVEWTHESRRRQRLLTTFTVLGWIFALLLTVLLLMQF